LGGLRDRALLLLGFAGALRRSELVALNVNDLEEIEGGLCIRIARSKTDREGEGAVIAIVPGEVACPISSIKSWLTAAKITDGPLHLMMSTTLLSDSHQRSRAPLRAGFLTSAAARGASIFKMMDVSRHRSVDALGCYVRDAERFRDHAGTGLL
jgi:integrase